MRGSQQQSGNNCNFIQRLVFRDVEHKPRMIISERGFNKGIHRWKFLVGCQCSRTTECLHQSANHGLCVDIGIVSLKMKTFMSPKTKKPRLCYFDTPFNLHDKTRFGNVGLDVAYYFSNVLPQNKAVIGTCGHNRKDKNKQFDQYVEFDYCINAGDMITMELDCDNNNLRFYINGNHLVGSGVKQAKFCNNGTISIMSTKNKTYFPVVAQRGCGCGGVKKGPIVDLIR